MIEVNVIGPLRQYVGGDNCLNVEFSGGMTVAGLLGEMGLGDAVAGHIIMVNGARKPAQHPLRDGDSIIVMPLLAGG